MIGSLAVVRTFFILLVCTILLSSVLLPLLLFPVVVRLEESKVALLEQRMLRSHTRTRLGGW
jgi:hypothetical protein